jgi:CBS domain-containing protein
MQVRDVMSTNLVTLDAHADLDLAEGLMSLLHVRHLPVVDHGRLAGLISHRDLLRAACRGVKSVPARALMRADIATIGPDANVRDAVEILLGRKIGCLPVVGERGELVGIVTEADFLQLTLHLLDRVDEEHLPAIRRLLLDRPRD